MSESRRKFLTAMTGALGGVGVTLASLPFTHSLNPPKHVERQTWDVEFPKLQPGQMMVAVIENTPIFITRRTPQQLIALNEANASLLDPSSKGSKQPEFAQNNHRSSNPEYFVAVGLCTHLGCSPTHVATNEDYLPESASGGYFCPCHGAVYDAAGRVFSGGPAPRNMRIPEYEFIEETKIRISRS